MPLEDFNKALSGIVNGIARKQSKGVIALLIQPTQWNAPGKSSPIMCMTCCGWQTRSVSNW